MIKNGVKYGMMNGVKGHPLEPSFAVDAACLLPSAVGHRCTTRTKKLLHAGVFLVPHAGLLPLGVSELLTSLVLFKGVRGHTTLLLSQPSLIKLAGHSSLHLPHQVRQAYHGRQPQHSSYEP